MPFQGSVNHKIKLQNKTKGSHNRRKTSAGQEILHTLDEISLARKWLRSTERPLATGGLCPPTGRKTGLCLKHKCLKVWCGGQSLKLLIRDGEKLAGR